MDKQEFLDWLTKEEEKVIAIDFDGVIHRSSLGFHDGTVYDPPIEGAREALQRLSERYTIIVYSCKANPRRPRINGLTGEELMWEWLEKYDMKQYVHKISFEKPNAVCYVDDKAVNFKNWDDVLKEDIIGL
jgi:ribonucleotide monophosphatase NagD (HAD superfamily)